MIARLVRRLSAPVQALAHALQRWLRAATKPAAAPLVVGTLADVARSKSELLLENALLRHHVIILQRSVKRPRCTTTDRALLVLLTSRLRTWHHALPIVQPETVLRWHRQLLRRVWRRRSQPTVPAHRPPLAPETVALIRQMAAANRLWGAERIRGELLKLDIRVAKRTIQTYMRAVRTPPSGQTWATFLPNHAPDIWAADFLPVTDLLFRPLYAFFIIALASRRIVHIAVTRHPSDVWLDRDVPLHVGDQSPRVAQQLREATPFGQHPKHLITDNDSKYGPLFARVATATGIDHIHTAYRAPLMNAVVERFWQCAPGVPRSCACPERVTPAACAPRVCDLFQRCPTTSGVAAAGSRGISWTDGRHGAHLRHPGAGRAPSQLPSSSVTSPGRTFQPGQAIPIVVMSTHLRIHDRAGQMRADAVLAKPFDLADLYAMVLAWMCP